MKLRRPGGCGGVSFSGVEHGEFRDPRLVPIYDAKCLWSREDDFFLSVAGQTPGARVLDLGCGTGRLTLGMAAAGYRVTGVDPAGASLDAARVKPGADRVTWIEGTSADVPEEAFDLVVMTSHVAQFLLEDEVWAATLADLHRALMPGGRLTFDSRDPAARGWEAWNPVDSRQWLTLPDGRGVEEWTEVTGVRGELVRFVHHYRFPAVGEALTASATLRFRTEEGLRSSLAAAGFGVEDVFGGWECEPVGRGDGEFLVIARR